MTCIPESGGCEKRRTEPFVAYLNKCSGTRFDHQACLDRMDRNSPQPEALYVDAKSGAHLVIERKSIVWPSDYAAKHQNDHLLASELTRSLREFAPGSPISICLGSGPRAPKNVLVQVAQKISESVRLSETRILGGAVVGGVEVGLKWTCKLDQDEREDFGEPRSGLVIRWTDEETECLSPHSLPRELKDKISQTLSSTATKFRTYSTAKRMLILDPFGELRHTGEEWWAPVLTSVGVPQSIDEIWLGLYDWITDVDHDWIFEKLYQRA